MRKFTSIFLSASLCFVDSPAHAALGDIAMTFNAGVLTLTSPTTQAVLLSCSAGNVAVNNEVPGGGAGGRLRGRHSHRGEAAVRAVTP